jgi:hypothetical protein
LADSDKKCASDKSSLKDTQNTLAANQEFMAMLKLTCADMDVQMPRTCQSRRPSRCTSREGPEDR